MSFNNPFDKLLIMDRLARLTPMNSISNVLNMSRSFASPVMISPLEAVTKNLAFVQKTQTPVAELIRQSVLSRMAQPTIFSIAEKLKSPIDNLLATEYHLDEFEEEVDDKQFVEVVDYTKAVIRDIYKDQRLLDTLDSRLFEKVVAELLSHKGFEVELTKQTRDGGYDILALNMVQGFPMKFLVECKRWKDTVGIDVVRSFCHVIQKEKANKGIIVTTSYFSPVSNDEKEFEGHILDLRNRDDLIQWVSDYNLNFSY